MTSKRKGIASFPGFGAIAAQLGVKRTKNNIQLMVPPLIASANTETSSGQGGPSGSMKWVRDADGRLVQQFIPMDLQISKNGAPQPPQANLEQPSAVKEKEPIPSSEQIPTVKEEPQPSEQMDTSKLEKDIEERLKSVKNEDVGSLIQLAGEAAQKAERLYNGSQKLFQSLQGKKGLESIELKEFLQQPVSKNQAYIDQANDVIKKVFPESSTFIKNDEELLSFLALVGPIVEADKSKQYELIGKIVSNADEAAKLSIDAEKAIKGGLAVEKTVGKNLLGRLGSLIPYVGAGAGAVATGIDTKTLSEHPWNPLNWIRVGGDLASLSEIPGVSQLGTLVSGAVDVVDIVTAPKEYKNVHLSELAVRVDDIQNVDERAHYKVLLRELYRIAEKIDSTPEEKQRYQELFKEVADGVMSKNKSSAA